MGWYWTGMHLLSLITNSTTRWPAKNRSRLSLGSHYFTAVWAPSWAPVPNSQIAVPFTLRHHRALQIRTKYCFSIKSLKSSWKNWLGGGGGGSSPLLTNVYFRVSWLLLLLPLQLLLLTAAITVDTAYFCTSLFVESVTEESLEKHINFWNRASRRHLWRLDLHSVVVAFLEFGYAETSFL